MAPASLTLTTANYAANQDPRAGRRVWVSVPSMRQSRLSIGDHVVVRRSPSPAHPVPGPITSSTDDSDRTAYYIGPIWPTDAVDGHHEVRLGPLARLNVNLRLGDSASITPLMAPAVPARTVALEFLTQPAPALTEFLRLYIQELLIDIRLIFPGMLVDVPLGTANYRLQATTIGGFHADPSLTSGEPMAYDVNRNTELTFARDEQPAPSGPTLAKVSYHEIGGLEKEVAAVRETVELPLTRPELFHKYGQRPPRGVLLYGPPGTGKTLIARAVASETDAFVTCINGPSVMSRFYGETEATLRRIFSTAIAHQPSIIFIDEIDALCPKRDESLGESEKRIVATLLTLMDGCADESTWAAGDQGAPRLVVIGATNRPDALDEALRRPGRFDREIEIGVPDQQARLAILRTFLRRIPHSLTEEDTAGIAAAAHGYVGADLAALCHEAGLRAIQQQVEAPQTSPGTDGGAAPGLDLKVSAADLRYAMQRVRPSAMREILLEVPKVYWRDIGGQADVKQKLQESVEWPLQHPEAFLRMGIRPPKGVLLYGPPGCSKTLMAKALATEAGLNFIAIKGPELFNKWVGESEKAVREVFRKARQTSPSIVFFDEIDALTVKRGGDGSSSVADRVLSQLLNELDGIEPLVNVTVVAATNRPDIMDEALLRPGRIDRMLYIGPPDEVARYEILRIQVAKMACAADVDVTDLAQRTEGFSGAEVVALCQEAAFAAMEEDVHAAAVAHRHFVACYKRFHRRITPEMLNFYAEFQRRQATRSA